MLCTCAISCKSPVSQKGLHPRDCHGFSDSLLLLSKNRHQEYFQRPIRMDGHCFKPLISGQPKRSTIKHLYWVCPVHVPYTKYTGDSSVFRAPYPAVNQPACQPARAALGYRYSVHKHMATWESMRVQYSTDCVS